MSWVWLMLFLLIIAPANALLINEIMYNPSGSDSGREWIEIYNNDNEAYNMTGWKLNTAGTDHALNVPPANGGRGTMIITPGEYIIISQDALFFTSNYTFNGTVIDSSWSDLSNSANETIWIKNSTNIFYNITYSPVAAESKTVCLINNSFIECIPTPGASNLVPVQNQTNATQSTCNMYIEIKSTDVSNAGSTIDFDLFVNDTACSNNLHNATVNYFVEDLFGIIVKPALNTTKELTCSSTISRQWTADDISSSEAYYIVANITNTGCNDTEAANNNAKKLVIVKGNSSSAKPESSINIISVNVGSDNEIKYGEIAAVDIEIYRGNTSKFAVDIYVLDSTGKKLSDISTIHANSKFTPYKFSVPVQMKSNCDTSLADGTFTVLAEGLNTNSTSYVNLKGISSSVCKTIVQSQSAGSSAVSVKNKTDINIDILDYNETLYSGDEFAVRAKIENNLPVSKNLTVYSYVFKGNNPVSLGYNEEKGQWLATYTANSKILEIKSKSSIDLELRNSIENSTASGLYKLRARAKYDDEEIDSTKEIAVIKIEKEIAKQEEQKEQEEKLNATITENLTQQRITGLAAERRIDITSPLSPAYAFLRIIVSVISQLLR